MRCLSNRAVEFHLALKDFAASNLRMQAYAVELIETPGLATVGKSRSTL